MRIPSSPLRELTIESVEVEELMELLIESVRLRVRNIPEPPPSSSPSSLLTEKMNKVAILFSGGLDCTVIARCVHEILPIGEGVDLLNVAFENKRVLEARNGEAAIKKKKQKKGSENNNNEEEIKAADQNAPNILIPEKDQDSNPPPMTSPSQEIYEICPDRLTGRKSLSELRKVCPGRHWNFLEINIPYTSLQSHRKTVISLIHPHCTEMDLSIALAFYFASRGSGIVASYSSPSCSVTPPPPPPPPPPVQYSTPARILLSGLGADELLAGYARHATAFKHRSYVGLLEELDLDVGRLGKRNLGRDDRVLAHWGKEARYPFLDEKVVKWCLETPVEAKCGFGQMGGGEEGKRVLRLVAVKMGMSGVAEEKKRAVQFGARSARMESERGRGKVKGTRVLTE